MAAIGNIRANPITDKLLAEWRLICLSKDVCSVLTFACSRDTGSLRFLSFASPVNGLNANSDAFLSGESNVPSSLIASTVGSKFSVFEFPLATPLFTASFNAVKKLVFSETSVPEPLFINRPLLSRSRFPLFLGVPCGTSLFSRWDD